MTQRRHYNRRLKAPQNRRVGDTGQKLRKLRVKHPQFLLCVWAVVLALDATGIARLGALCALLHEGGHLLAYRVLTGQTPALEISLGGLRLQMRGLLLPPGRELILAAAGILCNLCCALTALLLMQYWKGYSYHGYWFAAANLLLAGANLLPVAGLDGARMLACIKEMYAP